MLKQILIVDDLITNRRILSGMLCKDYAILEASSGEEALSILAHEPDAIAAVLLDISMPGMDGFEVLQQIRADAQLSNLPIIMITGNDDNETRVKSLALGANDFAIKPYSSEIIRHCLQNNIALREASETVEALQRDRLTGLYNREAFFDKVQQIISTNGPGHYTMACFDISKFKIINDQYGPQKGDEVLRHVAATFKNGFEPHGGICARIFADSFAVLYPTQFQDSAEIAAIRDKAACVEGLVIPIIFGIGRYIINDVSISPSAMYDRAMLAAETVKGRFDTVIAIYDDAMREHLILEQEIVLEMEDALKERQFELWFQPQYNHSTSAMIGAEALVRWRHPRRGLIAPNDFIPVFEQNGFIYDLDKFVWEEACRLLRTWLDEGHDPLPISVNVSRYDILRPDVIETITKLVKRYELPQDLLRLEITESAFSESSQEIVRVVKDLLACGFTIEIDDFGSGYSSLNTLKDVPAQIIKIDMKFLESSDDSERGGNIVESIVRMAKWLGMDVIAEGVETREQADYLRSIGCSYMQGYLYARPMPVEQYEEHCSNSTKKVELIGLETVENLDNNAFWNPASMDTLIFNSYVGGACIYEYHRGKIELLRVTKKYVQVIGSAGMTVEDALKLNWAEHLDEEDGRQIIADLERSIATRDEVTGDYVFIDLPGCPHKTYLRSTMRVIASTGDHYLVYCTHENITEQVKASEKVMRLSQQMQAIMDNVDLGIICAVLEDGKARYLFTNDHYYSMLGYTKEQFEAEIDSPYETVAPEDWQNVMDETVRINNSGESTVLVYDAITRDGGRRKFRAAISMGRLAGIDGPVQLSILRDITEEVEAEQREREAAQQIRMMMDSTTDLSFTKDINLRYMTASRAFANMVGYASGEDIVGKTDYEIFERKLAEKYIEDDKALLASGTSIIDMVESIPSEDDMPRYSSTSKYLLRDRSGETIGLYGVGRDITKQRELIEQLRISEEESNLAGQLGRNIICRYFIADKTLTLSPEVATAYSLPETITGVPYEPVRLGMISPESVDAFTGFFESINHGSKAATATFQHNYMNEWRWIEARSTTIFADDGTPVKAVISLYDVTEQLERETIYKK